MIKPAAIFQVLERGHGGRVVTLSPPTSEIGVRISARPEVGKLVIASVGWQFTVQKLDQLYILVCTAHKTTHHDMTYIQCVENNVKTQMNEKKWIASKKKREILPINGHI